MKSFLLFILALCSHFFCQGQISLTNASPYAQNFDALATTGTSATLPLGWLISESGTNANTLYTAGTGSANSGDTYSFGAAASTERSLGTLQSGSNVPTIGVGFTNNTLGSITSITITYTAEQWRMGAAARLDKLDFQYSTDATSLTTGTWVDVNGLDANAPTSAGTVGALDGNLAANKATVTLTISGLDITNTSSVYLRWQDFNATGADDGIGIDDFSMSFNISGGPNDNVPPVILNVTPAHSSINVSQNPNCNITFNEPVQKKTGNLFVKRNSDNTVIATIPVASTNQSGNSVSFAINNLALNTGYYIEVPAGAFADLNNNNMAAFGSATTWSFTTLANSITSYNFPFTTCTTALTDGFTQFSQYGSAIWACTAFGNNSNGVQMNGFVTGIGAQNNEDWLISPQLDLSAFNIPLLKFWSINRFNGAPLQLKISTTYNGSGNPLNAIWMDLFAPLPDENSNVGQLSENINLAAFKGTNVYIAFVYNSTTAGAARWTLDDIQITNAAALPDVAIFMQPNTYNFGTVTVGSQSAFVPFVLNVQNPKADVSFVAPEHFEISTNGTTPVANINYTINQLRNSNTFYVRAKPTKVDAANLIRPILFSTNNVNYSKGLLQVSSLSATKTLEIVNWNLDWFGKDETIADPGPWGPTDENLQEQNVKTVLRNLDADVYALVEVCDTSRLRRVVDSLNNGSNTWGFAVCNFGSGADDPSAASFPAIIRDAQKEAIVYKKSVLSNVTSRAFLRTASNYDSVRYYWSSGRLPYLVEADATIAGITKPVKFLILHAKANTGTTAEKIESYRRRKLGLQAMKDSLDANYSTANIIILGDFNDDLDKTIAPITSGPDTASTYSAFVLDSSDANHYKAVTFPLTAAGLRSTVTNSEVIDHVIISNEMSPFFMANSEAVRSDIPSILSISPITYAGNTTDHYPIFTRYNFLQNAPSNVVFIGIQAQKQNQQTQINFTTNPEFNSDFFEVEYSVNGRDFYLLQRLNSAGFVTTNTTYNVVDAVPKQGLTYYRVKALGRDGRTFYSGTKSVYFGVEGSILVAPNPAIDRVMVYVANSTNQSVIVNLIDALGKKVSTTNGSGNSIAIELGKLQKGMYILQVLNQGVISTRKILKQ